MLIRDGRTISIRFTFADEQPGGNKVEAWLQFPATKEELHNIYAQFNMTVMPEGTMTPEIIDFKTASPVEWLPELPVNETNINEFNYLAAKLEALNEDDVEKFEAAAESGRHRGDAGAGIGAIADLINIADNLDSFTFHRGFDAREYGNHLLTGSDSMVDRLIRELRNRSHGSNEEYARYVECLLDCVNAEKFGETMAEDNDGDFLDSGYLIEDGGFEEEYGGVQDIPDEYRIWESDDPFIIIKDAELSGLLIEMHAFSGNYTQDAFKNYQALMSGECFILINAEKLTVLPAAEVLRKNSPENIAFNEALHSPVRAFFAEIKETVNDKRRGNIHELDPDVIVNQIADFGYTASQIDVEFKDGTNGLFTISEWDNFTPEERGRAAGTEYRYESDNLDELNAFMRDLREAGEKVGNSIGAAELIVDLNKPFMAKAQNQQPDMLRIAREAAASMLARGDAEVYRLMPEGAVRLSALDAVKVKGLWFPEHREFAIKIDGFAGLRKWADRTAKEFNHRMERGELKKSHDVEH